MFCRKEHGKVSQILNTALFLMSMNSPPGFLCPFLWTIQDFRRNSRSSTRLHPYVTMCVPRHSLYVLSDHLSKTGLQYKEYTNDLFLLYTLHHTSGPCSSPDDIEELLSYESKTIKAISTVISNVYKMQSTLWNHKIFFLLIRLFW